MERNKTLTVKVILMFFVISLMGCGLKRQVEPQVKYIERPALQLPAPAPIELAPVNWIVLNGGNIDKVLDEVAKSGSPRALFALDVASWQNLNVNLAKIRSYIEMQNANAEAIKSYYNIPKSPIITLDNGPAPIEQQKQEEKTNNATIKKPAGLKKFLGIK